MFALSILTMFLALCMVVMNILSIGMADRIEKLERQLEEMKKNGKT